MSAVPTCVVAFDWGYWSSRYPELAAYVAQPQAQAYFTEAGLYCDNGPCSKIPGIEPGQTRYLLIHMVTAHIAALNAPIGGSPSSPLVGRINNVTQGSISAQAEMKQPTAGGEDWFKQTKYGAAYWQASAQYRTFRYVPGPQRNIEPWPWALGSGFEDIF